MASLRILSLVLLIGAAVRLFLFSRGFHVTFVNSYEVTTPISSFKRRSLPPFSDALLSSFLVLVQRFPHFSALLLSPTLHNSRLVLLVSSENENLQKFRST
jgi:hypothetical protein